MIWEILYVTEDFAPDSHPMGTEHLAHCSNATHT